MRSKPFLSTHARMAVCILLAQVAAMAQAKVVKTIKSEYPIWIALNGDPTGTLTIKNGASTVGILGDGQTTVVAMPAGTYQWEFTPANFNLPLTFAKANGSPDKLLLTFLVDPSSRKATIGYERNVGKFELAPRYMFYDNSRLFMKFQ